MSTNVSKQKREDLLAKIKAIRTYIATAPQDENTANLLAYLSELEKDVGAKKYGLVFEEHREEIDEVLSTHTPVLTEDGSLFIDNGGQMNFLIEGDNLASLHLLKKSYRGKIDLIYIDPPYNTGNKDFRYDDAFVDKNDLFTHSKWLSFMDKRLRIARQLLSESGAIFVSIDDNEEASLQMLCDSIFGVDCFVSNIAWQRTYSKRNDSKGIPAEVEHILVYSKQPLWMPKRLPRTAEMNENYKSQDGDPREWSSVTISAPGAATHQGMVYAIQHPITGEYMYPPKGRCWSFGQPQMFSYMNEWAEYVLQDVNDFDTRCEICGRTDGVAETINALVLKNPEEGKQLAFERYQRGINKEQPWPLLYFTGNGKGGIRRKQYLDTSAGRVATNLWLHAEVGHTGEATNELAALFGGHSPFDTPKPTRLIDRIIEIASSKNSVILDFFAGSGTTGHAILKYNSEHKDSSRRFILCTNNENNICREVTYERIKRVIDKEGYAASLKYFKVDYIPVSERMYYEYADELLAHIRELVELENGINFTGNAEVGIVLTDDELNAFIQNGEAFAKCRKLYMGHDLLPDEEQEKILRERGVEISIIPDYYYRDLQEG